MSRYRSNRYDEYDRYDRGHCNICSRLKKDFGESIVDIKTKCPSYYIARGRILDIKNNLVIMALPFSGIIVICCDNISFVRPSGITLEG